MPAGPSFGATTGDRHAPISTPSSLPGESHQAVSSGGLERVGLDQRRWPAWWRALAHAGAPARAWRRGGCARGRPRSGTGRASSRARGGRRRRPAAPPGRATPPRRGLGGARAGGGDDPVDQEQLQLVGRGEAGAQAPAKADRSASCSPRTSSSRDSRPCLRALRATGLALGRARASAVDSLAAVGLDLAQAGHGWASHGQRQDRRSVGRRQAIPDLGQAVEAHARSAPRHPPCIVSSPRVGSRPLDASAAAIAATKSAGSPRRRAG